MAEKIRSLSAAKKKIESLTRSTRKARAKAGELMETLVSTGEVAGAAFAIGYWEGKATDADQFEIFNVPGPLAIGVVGHAFALMGVGRGMESHLRNIANGALASHANGLGRKYGQESKIKAAASGDTGELPNPAGVPGLRGVGISEADLIRRGRGAQIAI